MLSKNWTLSPYHYHIFVIWFSFISIVSAQNFWRIKQFQDEKPKELNKIIWCTISPEENNKCLNFAMANERDQIKVGYETIKIECKQATHKDECMTLMDEEKVTMTTLDAGEVFVGGRYHSLVPIAQEVLDGGFKHYYAVAVIKKNTLPDTFSLTQLKYKKACFAGVETFAGWMLPINTLMKEGGMEIIDCNNHVKSASNYFGPSCAVNCLTDKFNPIGDNSDKLCQLCTGKIPGGRCTYSDPYAGYAGAFRCLLEAGEIAFLKHTTVPELVTAMGFAGLSVDNFELFCKDGTRKPINEYLACNWGKVPTDAVVISSAVSFEDRIKFQRYLVKFAERYSAGYNGSQEDNHPRFGTNKYQPEYDQFGNRIRPDQNEYDQYGNRINRFKRQNFGDLGTQDTRYGQDQNRENRYGQNQYNRGTVYGQDGNSDNRYGQGQENRVNRYGQDSNTDNRGQENRDNRYGQGSNTDNRYGQVTDRNIRYGQDSDNRYEQGQENRDNRYGQDSNTDNRYGQGQENSDNRYGQESNNDNRYGQDQGNQDNRYGQHQDTGDNKYGTDQNTDNRYGQDQFGQDSNQYGRDFYSTSTLSPTSGDNQTNVTFYEVFRLFESKPRYGIHGNLLFQDSTKKLAPVPENQQTYSTFLGESLNIIMGVRDCPVNRMTLCVTSDAEKNKCVKMRTALNAQLLKPEMNCYKGHSQIHCMQAIRAGTADVAVLDASDVYTAGLNFDLVPFISEVYNLEDADYYVVAVAKESDPSTELTYLRTKYTCHGGINTAAGWVYPLAFLISNGWIRPYGCNSIRAAAEYFTKSCVPGALSTEYNTGVPYDNMCDLCHGASYRYCRRDASEDYYGHTGAFRCLVEGGGHVAFVKHTTVTENTGGKKREWWARDNLNDDFELLCPDGTRAEINEYQTCNLGKVKANAIVTRGGYGYNETHINAYINLFMYAQTFYGRKHADEFSFSMFTSTPPYSDLIFQDATTQLRVIKPDKRYYSDYLGPDFMRARRIVDCNAGAVSITGSLLILTMSAIFALFVVRN